MASNYVKVYSVSMTSLATLSPAVDLSKSYEKVAIEVRNTMVSGSLFVHVSSDNSNYSKLCGMGTDPVTHFVVNSASSGLRHIPLPNTGFRYMKIENTSGVSDTVCVFKVICAD